MLVFSVPRQWFVAVEEILVRQLLISSRIKSIFDGFIIPQGFRSTKKH